MYKWIVSPTLPSGQNGLSNNDSSETDEKRPTR